MSKRKRANLTDILNDLTFKKVFDKYKLLAVSAFEWEGLPCGIKSRHIEKLLFSHGRAIFFKDRKMSFMCLKCDDGIGVNVYGEPVQYLASGFGYRKYYDADKCVVIENNILRYATEPFIYFYVNKLTEAERTMDVNIKAVKTPIVFTCDEKNVLTFKQIFQQVDGNVPALFADKNISPDTINAFQTGAKFLCNDIMDYKKSVDNEVLTFLGYNNLAVDKKERVNVPEVESNNGVIESFAKMQEDARKEACKLINDMYGLNVSVKRKGGVTDVQSLDNNESDD